MSHSTSVEADLRRVEKFCQINHCTLIEMKAQVEYAYRRYEACLKIIRWFIDQSPIEELLLEAAAA